MNEPREVFPLRGELAELIAKRDWSETSLGPMSSWPASLHTILRVLLTSRYAMWLGWGRDLTFFYNDAYAEQTLGAKHPWALGRPAREVWAEIWDALAPRIDQVLATGEATWDEGLQLFLERSGFPEETYHTFSYSPLPGDDGRIAGMFCVVVEETERVISERRMGILRSFASSLSHANTTDEVLAMTQRSLVDRAGGVPFSFVYLFDSETKLAHLRAQTQLPDDHPEVPKTVSLTQASAPWGLAEIFAGAESLEMELREDVSWPKGPWPRAPHTVTVSPIGRPGDATPTGALVVAQNPHRPVGDDAAFLQLFVGQLAAGLANAQAHEEANRRAEALAELDRTKTAFFSNVSHEFRTPLTLMLGPTEDALASNERALSGQDLEIVHRNELRLLKLVNTLLDFSRIEAGRIEASYEKTDLSALTAELASVFRSAIERAGLRLELSCPPLSQPAFVDHDMWEKIVLNLLSNALKFTFEGSISVSIEEDRGAAIVRVRDTGTGVPPGDLPHLFERFHRVQNAPARTHEGSGIGLALVAELVKLQGGTVSVESTFGKGTCFSLRVPLGCAHLPKQRIVAERSKEIAPTRAASFVQEALRWNAGPMTGEVGEIGGQMDDEPTDPGSKQTRILLADDNADMRDYVARLLREHWSVETFSDGRSALDALRDRHFDLVLADVMMPGLDGFELVRAMRHETPLATLPVILLSARAGDEAVADGLRSGADDYLVKPFSAGALVMRVGAQLAAARSRETLRRQAEAERERLAAMFEVSPSALGVLRGPDLVIELANPHLLTIWGKTDAVIGKPLLEGLPEIQGQGFFELLQRVRTTGVPYEGRAVLARLDRHRTGELVDGYFDFVYAPMRDDEGHVTGVLVHAFEVTELVRERRAAETANRMKDEFLATMSHELRTPLNAILGWSSLLRAKPHDDASREKALATIERNARAQARLIDDILDVSRIVSGKLRLNMRRVDIVSVVSAAIDVVRPAILAKGIALETHVDKESGAINGDPDRLQQVVWNLLINAVRFTPSGGKIEVRVERSDSNLRIVVSDTGTGIPAELLPHVFERFRQADSSTTRQHSGLGLGLAIVRHVVELHGGSVSASSEGANRGAAFVVTLPIHAVLAATPGEAARPSPVEPETGDARGDLDGVRILVVDDDTDSRDLVASALESAGAKVASGGSAREALARLQDETFDALVSDIGMPDEDGYSLIRRVRALPSDHPAHGIPAIALTAYARRDDHRAALAAGYDRHLAKPVEAMRLVSVVADTIEVDRRGGG